MRPGMAHLACTNPLPTCVLHGCRKGNACIIPGSKDFFIATADHTEWGNSHVVWGQVGRALHCAQGVAVLAKDLRMWPCLCLRMCQ